MLGALRSASNAAFLVEVATADEEAVHAIYKPVRGERPLWDFPHGTLAAREVAAWVVSEAGRFGMVPPTVLRHDAPLGTGSVQLWIGALETPADPVVDAVAPDAVPSGWLPVLSGLDQEGNDILVVHPDTPALRSVATFDAVVNNADRKGSHLMLWRGELHAIDHGVTFHVEDKLRTVLWAWAGQPIPAADIERLHRLATLLRDGDDLAARLADLLTRQEVRALAARVDALLASGRHPEPAGEWPAVPWPPL